MEEVAQAILEELKTLNANLKRFVDFNVPVLAKETAFQEGE